MSNVPAHRIPNGTHITFTSIDWVGIVVDQNGSLVTVTGPDQQLWQLDRDSVVRTGRTYEVRGNPTEMPSAVRVVLTVPSDTELPADLYYGDRDYTDGWMFTNQTDAIAFAEKAMADHPGVVVDYTLS
jgi:hypothetical protein